MDPTKSLSYKKVILCYKTVSVCIVSELVHAPDPAVSALEALQRAEASSCYVEIELLGLIFALELFDFANV